MRPSLYNHFIRFNSGQALFAVAIELPGISLLPASKQTCATDMSYLFEVLTFHDHDI